MDSPLNYHTGQTGKPGCLDISPERLNSLSPSELEQAMEEALSIIVEEDYDPAVIDAYLDALDSKVPMPAYPDAKTSYADFQQKVCSLLGTSSEQSMPNKKHVRLRRVMRVGLVAVLTVVCLFGSIAAVQATGVDVFGVLARWTESAFSFGPIQLEEVVEEPLTTGQQTNISSDPAELPSEYQQLWTALRARGVDSFMFPTYFPDGFQVEESNLYLPEELDVIDFTVWYVDGGNDISFSVLYGKGPTIIYEKDTQDVEIYTFNGIDYYIFSNNGRTSAAWYTEDLEYSLSTNITTSELKTIINSMC